MAIVEWALLTGLGIFASFSLINVIRGNQQRDRLDQAFYYLLDAENSCVSLIQLAATAKVDAGLAKQYLEEQVRTFGAMPEVDEDGDQFYRFPKLRRWSESQEWE